MCVLKKQHRDAFQTNKSWRAKRSLEIIYSYLCIVEVPSNGGCMYFITFTYDFSRKFWVYFLKQNYDVCDIFKIFKTFIRQSRCQIKILRADRDQEYLVCDDFLENNRIQHQLNIRCIPQQNGVIEIKNMTVMNIMSCILKLKNIPKSFGQRQFLVQFIC